MGLVLKVVGLEFEGFGASFDSFKGFRVLGLGSSG